MPISSLGIERKIQTNFGGTHYTALYVDIFISDVAIHIQPILLLQARHRCVQT